MHRTLVVEYPSFCFRMFWAACGMTFGTVAACAFRRGGAWCELRVAPLLLSNSLRKLGLNERTGEMLIKLRGSAASLFLLFLAFPPSPFHYSFISTSWALELLSGSGRSPAAKRHLVNLGLKECFWCEQF